MSTLKDRLTCMWSIARGRPTAYRIHIRNGGLHINARNGHGGTYVHVLIEDDRSIPAGLDILALARPDRVDKTP